MKHHLDIDWLKANHRMIHYFGLGFIQVKIDDTERLHFYTTELPPIVPEEDVHNHRYDFTSFILKGEFKQELFLVTVGDSHTLEDESCKKDAPTDTTRVPCGLTRFSSHIYNAGSSYFIDHNTFHRVKSLNCITLLRREPIKKDFAQVVRPKGAAKVCPFSQTIEEARLWEIVESMLRV